MITRSSERIFNPIRYSTGFKVWGNLTIPSQEASKCLSGLKSNFKGKLDPIDVFMSKFHVRNYNTVRDQRTSRSG